MLSELYRVEVVVACCENGGTLLRYGGGLGRPIIYTLYTGQHYDPLVGPPPEHTRVWPPDDGGGQQQQQQQQQQRAAAAAAAVREVEAREAAALTIAREHAEHAARLASERSQLDTAVMPAP